MVMQEHRGEKEMEAMKILEQSILQQVANYLVQENLLNPEEQIRFLDLLIKG